MKTLTALILMIIVSLPAFASRLKVRYEIPAPEGLAPYSRFDIEYKTQKHDDGTTELRYRMPKLLLGEEQEFRFRGVVNPTATSFTLSSDSGAMNCERLPSQTLCNVVHKNVAVNLEAVKAELESMPITIEEKIGRLGLSELVARRGGDMVGVLTYASGLDY